MLPLAVAGTRAGLRKRAFLFGTCRALVCVEAAIDPAPVRTVHTDIHDVVNWHAAAEALAATTRA